MGLFYRAIIIISLLIPSRGWTQTIDCEQTIALAMSEFNAGHFYSVPGILSECLQSFTREQKQRAYLLLTQTYLLLDDPDGAQKSYLEILTANPEFVPDDQLHAIDIVYLSKRFTATPRFSWFGGAGSNVSPVHVILDQDAMNDLSEKYRFLPGYNFGVGGEFSYSDNIRIRLELNYLHTAYRAHARNFFQYDSKIIDDRQSWLNVPVFLCYSDNIGTNRPYFCAGYSISRLLGDKASITLQKGTRSSESDGPRTIPESPKYDFRQRRNDLNHSLIFGGGVKHKIGLDFVFVELRYSIGLKNVVNPDYAYGNHSFGQTSGEWVLSSSPTTEYAHVDDYFRLDNLAITFGFVRPLYQPRELKRPRTNGILRKMKRSR